MVMVLGVWLVCFVVCLFVCCRGVLSTGMAAAELNAKQITNCKRQLPFFLGSFLPEVGLQTAPLVTTQY